MARQSLESDWPGREYLLSDEKMATGRVFHWLENPLDPAGSALIPGRSPRNFPGDFANQSAALEEPPAIQIYAGANAFVL
jgi:hypothetical protein